MPRLVLLRGGSRREPRLTWIIAGKSHTTDVVPGLCPKCYAEYTVAALPPPLLAQQADGTTHVCVPALGGCNHGFAKVQE